MDDGEDSAVVALYVEHDPFAAQWLTQLIARDLIAPGIVDSRDLEDIAPCELMDFTQVHLCAGIGIWSLALRRAGWPDDRPVWTASFPCQPFSAAGKGAGIADERHVWPSGHWLIDQCHPDVIFGEQVSSKDGLGWFDIVSADLEGSGYACGAYDLCAAGFGMEWAETQAGQWLRGALHDCPDALVACALSDFADWADAHLIDGGHHIRQRLYWLADANGGNTGAEWQQRCGQQRLISQDGGSGGLADANGEASGTGLRGGGPAGFGFDVASGRGDNGGLEDAQLPACERFEPDSGAGVREQIAVRSAGRSVADRLDAARSSAGMLRGKAVAGGLSDAALGGPASPYRPERPADWLLCTDGKWRSTRSGAQPLANAGTYRNRVGLLRGSGNALHADTAQAFIEAYLSR